ncbi:MAG: hypothetical protein JO248_13330 [Acidimicrobiia bacterium]|nr:hypothetical protein [Acidimicrobiia bacterium]
MRGLNYRVIDGHVEVTDGSVLVWWGDVDGQDAYEAIALPGSDDGIVVFDWSKRPEGVEQWHPYENLVRIRRDGSIVWTAPLPGDQNSYTGVKVHDDGRLLGFLWSHTAEIDPETGEVVRWWFTK